MSNETLTSMVVVLFALLLLIVVATGLNDRNQRDDIDRMEADIVRLQILACGFEQFEDGSVRPQRNDQIRFDCITQAVPK